MSIRQLRLRSTTATCVVELTLSENFSRRCEEKIQKLIRDNRILRLRAGLLIDLANLNRST